jgi:shikimate kinase
MKKHIVLVGLMGSGKSTVGKRLAWELGRPWIDTDAHIVEQEGRSIAEIFAKEGEPYFRKQEAEAIAWALGQPARVISVGGGAFAQEANLQKILRKAFAVYLSATPETLAARVSRKQKSRPLVAGEADPTQRLRELLTAREPFYAQAHVRVECDALSHEQVVAKILAQRSAFDAE